MSNSSRASRSYRSAASSMWLVVVDVRSDEVSCAIVDSMPSWPVIVDCAAIMLDRDLTACMTRPRSSVTESIRPGP